jgi:RecB family endonuclease NucS
VSVYSPTVGEVVACIERSRYRYATEDELQQGLLEAITGDGWPVVREARLDRYSRLDLLVGDQFDGTGIAVEVKVAGGRADALRQIRRYVGYPQVGGLVLVTSRVRHGAVPTTVLGKPVRVVQLALQSL